MAQQQTPSQRCEDTPGGAVYRRGLHRQGGAETVLFDV
jgi:hypothetical protein